MMVTINVLGLPPIDVEPVCEDSEDGMGHVFANKAWINKTRIDLDKMPDNVLRIIDEATELELMKRAQDELNCKQ